MRARRATAQRVRAIVARVASLVPCAVVCVLAASPLRAQRPHAAGWRVAPDVAVRLFVPAGRVRVVAWAQDSVDVRGTIGPVGDVFGGGSRTALKLGLEPASPGDPRLPSADWTVRLPARARLFVKMVDGTIEATGARGELELYTVSGSITVTDAGGAVSVESVDAPVTATRVDGALRVRGGRGTTRIADAAGTLSVTAIGGAVTLERVASEGRIETIGGTITVHEARLAAAGRLDLQTHDGAIVLVLPRARRPRLDLASRGAPVRGDGDAGRAALGTIVARSFRGAITVRETPRPPAATATRR